MQHAVEREVADILAAPAQEAQVLDPLDRAADQPVGGPRVLHQPASSFGLSRMPVNFHCDSSSMA